ncbi:hypothetical protein; putative signal peptide [Frankia alni ACN14a]|uniref:Uncharacterized protein n=1 Tax=Frankia alni (strain DSM 45986 / CECT 9034 / ACN14a) TaxID=326424 RepID=Q0RQ00_FRAAA|nr:hypothetical protein; putative signal peptide [Frankia alni ACN14a]
MRAVTKSARRSIIFLTLASACLLPTYCCQIKWRFALVAAPEIVDLACRRLDASLPPYLIPTAGRPQKGAAAGHWVGSGCPVSEAPWHW